MNALEAWNTIAEAVRRDEPVAVYVSPELYFEQCEWAQGINSAYASSAPEAFRLPWLGIEGVPVVVDPELQGKSFALLQSRDFIDDMRVALDIYTAGMVGSVHNISTEDSNDTSGG